MTNPTPLPPDPVAYDAVRNEHARRRGLPTPYIPGGEDPDLATTLRTERRYLRYLVWMAVIIIVAGFVLGIATALLNIPLLDPGM